MNIKEIKILHEIVEDQLKVWGGAPDCIDGLEAHDNRGELLKMLERVAELPEKWKSKDRYDHYDTSSESKTMTKCANELQAILEDKT